MTNKKIKVLHIDSQKEWRGGQQQAVYLFEAMLNNGYEAMFACKPGSALSSYFTKKTLPFITENMFGEIDFISAFKIALYCKKNNFNVLYLHSAGAHSIGLMAKIFYRRLKIIGVRRVDFKIRKNFLSQIKYKSSLVNSIVCVSNGVKKVMLSCGINDEKLKVIHDGIDIKKFEDITLNSNLKNELKIPKNDIIIGTIAALVGHKDYPTLLRAAKIVLDKLNNVTFIAVGDGVKEEELKALQSELNLENKFIFAGFQKNVAKYFTLFDIFVLASKMEGLGTSILDAQSVGLPVVATRAGGIPEVVENNFNGLLVEPQNPNELADTIIKLITDKKLRAKLGETGKKTVENFDISVNFKKNIELIETLI